jgi:hypothetical protein
VDALDVPRDDVPVGLVGLVIGWVGWMRGGRVVGGTIDLGFGMGKKGVWVEEA